MMSFPSTGYRGWPVGNAAADAFVIADPYPRIVDFRLPGERSVLHVSKRHEFFGVRTWFMEPEQNDQSGLPARMRGRTLASEAAHVHLRTDVEPESRISLSMDVRLHESRPRLDILHGITNHDDGTREIAAWAITAVAAETGLGLTRLRQDDRQVIVCWTPSQLSEPMVVAHEHALALDFRIAPRGSHLKIGTDANCGWVACISGRHALVSKSEFKRGALYPEGGSTVTMFRSGSLPDGAFAEIENVGPLTQVEPGETITMQQRLEIVDGEGATDIDSWLEVLDAATDGQ